MVTVRFYDNIDDQLLKFAVIVSRYSNKWVFCKHKERSTYECPGGHREAYESIEKTAERELWEETGAIEFSLRQVCVYSVCDDEKETYGMLYYADISDFGHLPALEIERIEFFDDLPKQWTYPLIQPYLIKKVEQVMLNN